MKRLCGGLAVLLAAAVVGCGDGSKADVAADHRLSGKVTVNGKPITEVFVIAVGPDGKDGGGQTTMTGEYTMPDPPKGLLKIHFMPGSKGIPVKYTKPGNGLTYEYTGGLKTYDISIP